MPRVLRIINRFNIGGPTYNASYLTKYLEPEFETMLVGGQKSDSEESSEHILEQIGVKAHIIPELGRDIRLKDDYIAYKKISAIIKEFKPDIVHTHASKAGALGRLAAINAGVPVILHTFHGHVFHSYFNRYKTLVFKQIERHLAKRSNGIIAISDIQKEELSGHHRIAPRDKTFVVPLGFDLCKFMQIPETENNRFRENFNIDSSQFTVSIIGRLVPIKNHMLFIDAFSLAKQTCSDMTALIIGDGELKEELIAYAKSKGLNVNGKAADIIFTSWIKDMPYAMAGSDLIVMTSKNEGTPVSLIEAQAAGKPIVTTDVGGIKNIISEGRTGMLASADARSIADCILFAKNNPEFRETARIEGPQFVAERFSYKRLAEDIKKLYWELLAKNS